MNMQDFITVGENIHCTRVVKSGGSRTDALPGGGEGVAFKYKGTRHLLPVPSNWADVSPVYTEGNIRHIALAIYQALNGSTEEDRQLGETYLRWAAERQVKNGAKFLDVNVDEYTNVESERVEIMKWTATFLASHSDTPLSIDSSNVKTLAMGLECCKKGVDPMVNSVSLEREEPVDVVMQYSAEAIVSAAGKSGLPSTIDERMTNFRAIVSILDGKGMARSKMHLDPLVFPISVDPMNGKNLFETTKAAVTEFEGVNINGGLSNISFGMPNRKLLNMVFTWLFAKAGGNGGIIDPVQMSPKAIGELDETSEGFIFAKNVLEGTDMFGGDYIQAHRDGKL